MTNEEQPAFTALATNPQSEYGVSLEPGLSKKEYLFTKILCAYISAGSNGMPDSKGLIEHAKNTYAELINHFNS